MFDYSWFDEVAFQTEHGIFFAAGGLFNYFNETEVAALCRAMVERFPGGELIFDAPSKIGNKILNRRFRKLGVKGITFYFSLGNPVKQISKWSDRIQVVDWFTLFARTSRNPKWRRKTQFLISVCDRFKLAKFTHVRFLQ